MQETEKPVTVLPTNKSESILILLVHLGLIFFGQLLLVALLQSTMQFILLQDRIPTEEIVGKSFDEISALQKKTIDELMKEMQTGGQALTKRYYEILFNEKQVILFWSSLMWMLSFLIPGYVVLARWMKVPISRLEDNFKPNTLGIGILGGIVVFFLVSGIGVFLILIDQKPKNNEFQTLLFKSLKGNLTLFGWSIYSVGLFTGLIEEWFFRGMLLKHYISKGLTKEGWIITSILFGVLHYSADASLIIPILLTGVGAFFGYLYLRSGNIWVPIIAHAVYNSITLVLAFFLGDQIT